MPMDISVSNLQSKQIYKNKADEYKVFLRGISKHNIGSDFQCIQDWNGIIIVISIYMYGKEKRADTSMRNYTVFFNEKYANNF